MEREIKISVRHLRLFAIVSEAVAFAFWVWAIVNTITGGPDLGVISFLAVMLSGAGLLRLAATKPERLRDEKTNVCTSRCVVASHILVALNYAAGAFLILSPYVENNIGITIYCIVFAMVWVPSAGLGWWLLKQHRRTSAEETTNTDDQESGQVILMIPINTGP